DLIVFKSGRSIYLEELGKSDQLSVHIKGQCCSQGMCSNVASVGIVESILISSLFKSNILIISFTEIKPFWEKNKYCVWLFYKVAKIAIDGLRTFYRFIITKFMGFRGYLRYAFFEPTETGHTQIY
ncbi:hypothetical protein M8C21_022094, partial [Ambrosia artemisiifolia]